MIIGDVIVMGDKLRTLLPAKLSYHIFVAAMWHYWRIALFF